jgi:DNA-directed RNA polymerase subunit alpha
MQLLRACQLQLGQQGLRLGQQLDRGHYDKIRTEMLEKLKGTVSEEVLNKPLSQLDCSVRARKALQLLGIHTLGDLAARTEAELMGVKNFGQTSLEELKQLLVWQPHTFSRLLTCRSKELKLVLAIFKTT